MRLILSKVKALAQEDGRDLILFQITARAAICYWPSVWPWLLINLFYCVFLPVNPKSWRSNGSARQERLVLSDLDESGKEKFRSSSVWLLMKLAQLDYWMQSRCVVFRSICSQTRCLPPLTFPLNWNVTQSVVPKESVPRMRTEAFFYDLFHWTGLISSAAAIINQFNVWCCCEILIKDQTAFMFMNLLLSGRLKKFET